MAVVNATRFQVFGTQHLVILGVFAVGCVAVVLLGRRLSPRADNTFRRTAGVAILVLCAPFEALDWIHAASLWRTLLPVQICDFAWLVAGVALLTRGSRWSAVLYYWGLTLSLQGVLTPELNHTFPDVQFFGFWLRHLAPVWAAAYLVGAGVGPTWRGYRFVLALTAVWAAVMMVINALLGSNYLYLNAKPVTHSVLDFFGPWPWYVAVEVVLVILVWALITWPWNRGTSRSGRAGGHIVTGIVSDRRRPHQPDGPHWGAMGPTALRSGDALEWADLAVADLDARTLYDVLAVRAEVFVVEQQCFYQDVDGLDLVEGTRHLLGRYDGRLVAYARILAPTAEQPAPRIGRVLVIPELRGRQLGRKVVRRALAVCEEQWPGTPVELAAQAHLAGFYASMRFMPVGGVFDEDGIPHQWMRRRT